MKDSIRKGVELAEGWEMHSDGEGFVRYFNKENLDFISFYFDEDLRHELQFGLDALVAQLVRQHLKRHGASVFTLWYADPMKTLQLVVDNQ